MQQLIYIDMAIALAVHLLNRNTVHINISATYTIQIQ